MFFFNFVNVNETGLDRDLLLLRVMIRLMPTERKPRCILLLEYGPVLWTCVMVDEYTSYLAFTSRDGLNFESGSAVSYKLRYLVGFGLVETALLVVHLHAVTL